MVALGTVTRSKKKNESCQEQKSNAGFRIDSGILDIRISSILIWWDYDGVTFCECTDFCLTLDEILMWDTSFKFLL